jgi:DNA-binding NarL/FixJ family response regulator
VSLSAVARPGQDGIVPEPDQQSAERKALARQADRRREAARMLALVEWTARYGASTLANGASPAEASETCVFLAEQLEAMAVALRRMAAPDGPAERRAHARRLAALGRSRREIAGRLGISERSVRDYLAG